MVFCSVFKALASKNVQFRNLPQTLETPLFTLFSSIFPCAHAAGQLKHIYKKSFKNIFFFFSVCFYIFSVKNAVIYTFFGLKSVQKHWFLQWLFQCSGIQKPFKISLFTVFVSFLSVLPLPEADQNDPKFRFNGLLSSDTQKSSKKRADTTLPRSRWSRCEIVFAPPPPAKADIATAIFLTHVLKHLV